jgi:hypothetical protein
MTTRIDLDDLERRAYRSGFEDGLPDIFIGTFIALQGVTLATDLDYLPALAAGTGIPLWRAVRRRITLPRVGTIRFGPTRAAREHSKKVTLAALLALTMFSGIGIFLLLRRGSPEAANEMTRLGPAPLGAVLGLILAVVGRLYELRRFYSHAALVVLSFAIPHAFGARVDPWVMAAGVAIVAVGVSLLVRFLRENPVPDLGERHGDS